MYFSKSLTKKEQAFLKDELKIVISDNLSSSTFVTKLKEALKPVETQLIYEKKISDNVIIIKTKSNDIFDSQEISLKSVMLRYNDAKDMQNFTNRLCILYLPCEQLDFNLHSMTDKLNEYCKIKDITDTKLLFIFEKTEDKIKALALEPNKKDYISLDEFRDLVFDMQFEHKIEYEHSESVNSSVDLILAFITLFCKKRNTVHSEFNPLDSAKISDNSKSKILGVENDLSITWVKLLGKYVNSHSRDFRGKGCYYSQNVS